MVDGWRPIDNGPEDEGGGIVHSRERGVGHKEHEELVVVLAHAICDPGAMVIHLFDAAAAHATVMGPARLVAVAHCAVAFGFALRSPRERNQDRRRVCARGRGVAGLSQDCLEV